MEYLCHKWPRICSTCRKHFPVLSSGVFYALLVDRCLSFCPFYFSYCIVFPISVQGYLLSHFGIFKLSFCQLKHDLECHTCLETLKKYIYITYQKTPNQSWNIDTIQMNTWKHKIKHETFTQYCLIMCFHVFHLYCVKVSCLIWCFPVCHLYWVNVPCLILCFHVFHLYCVKVSCLIWCFLNEDTYLL
jgi:hypothetical protein